MRGPRAWWRDRRDRRANAAYLAEEVELIDLAALERGRSRDIDLRDPVDAER